MFLKLTSTVGTFVLPSAGVLIGVAPGSTFTDADLLMVLSASSELRALVVAGNVVVNDGSSDLSPADGNNYLTRLWSQAGGDSKIQMANVEGNVTNDAQLKRARGDFDTFAEKTHPVEADLLLIEDSADSLRKKKIQLANAAKFTYRIERLGVNLATGLTGGRYLKMRYTFLADEAFVRVYEDGVPLTFGVDWNWNPQPKTSGMSLVDILVDGVEILSAITPDATYRLEVDEIPLGIVPTIMLWRADGEGVTKSNIWNKILDVYGAWQTLSSINYLDAFGWRASYTGPTDIDHLYGDRMGVGWFDKGADIPAQWSDGSWWMEVYHIGARSNQNRLGIANNSSRMQSCLVPVIASKTNDLDLTAAPFVSGGNKMKTGHYVVRLRDRATNRVTQFSAQTMYLRRIGIRSDDYATPIGFYTRSGVK